MASIFSKASIMSAACVLLLSSCGGGGSSGGGKITASSSSSSSSSIKAAVSKFSVAQPDSPYSDVLVGCLDAETFGRSCRLSALPYLGQTTSNPVKADILARTITTHPWMATRFSELLDKMPDDMLLLFRGVTGVVIGADVRPSYYYASTGAIYLDPADLWLNLTERNTISLAPDYREDFGFELKFISPARYVKGNSNAWAYYSLTGAANNRSIDKIVQPMAALLFHELAHANDFTPPALMAQLDPQSTPDGRIEAAIPKTISTSLTASMPLTSSMLYGAADVMFHGLTATAAQKQLTAGQVGLEFAIDGASDFYAYSSQWEDTAMLFEEVMMKYHFGLDRDVAFTDFPTAATASCDDYVVRWGVRNRIGNETVKARAKIIVPQLLGRSDASSYFANLPLPRSMHAGVGWCSNISTFNSAAEPKLEKISNQPIPAGDLRRSH